MTRRLASFSVAASLSPRAFCVANVRASASRVAIGWLTECHGVCGWLRSCLATPSCLGGAASRAVSDADHGRSVDFARAVGNADGDREPGVQAERDERRS